MIIPLQTNIINYQWVWQLYIVISVSKKAIVGNNELDIRNKTIKSHCDYVW